MKLYDEKSEKEKELKLYSLDNVKQGGNWRSVKFKHPFTFEALAMEPGVKKEIMDDLERFIGRKEFYKKVGRAWKRGYLLYGPPGTGKSSLIAAMANHLKFDIYDLQLSSVINDSALRRLLLFTTNKSILVIEDIDCSLRLADRQLNVSNDHEADINSQISLSGLLNFIDGLWSSCGDERIFIFTTNHKDKLDPALLRPGRMDMHIHMSYLTMPAFRVLAHNYLNILDEHHLFNEIEHLIQTTKVSPAQVAEVLIRSDDPEISLSSVITMLKQHKLRQVEEKIDFPNLMNGGFSNGIGHDHLSSADEFSDD
ncbi:AAA-ATPase At5g17760-like [Amaranthus tricolor]|uniref:AAA-ATPase At5g17760-like n=1 Tax=Amaranthus tricolor TaxID=29722 RepID=UPI0025897465|nr:AAA-ATPase At5g17760-like [Amaranthus tricolor]